jgi:hypothetical protein
MGRLMITQVTDMIALAEEVASSAHVTPPSLLVTVQVDKQRYLFTVTGAPRTILVSQTLIFTLNQILAAQSSAYGIPQHITFLNEDFLTKNFVPKTVTATHSAAALYNLLTAVIAEQTPGITSLLIDDQAKSFQYGNWRSGHLEYLPEVFSQLTPLHCAEWRALQLSITPNSLNIIMGFKDLIMRDCLTQLTTLYLPYSARCQPHSDEQWLSLMTKEVLQLSDVYYRGLRSDSKLNLLTHVRLTLWLGINNFEVIQLAYPQLHTLTLDCVMPLEKEAQLTYQLSELDEAIEDKVLLQDLIIYADNAAPLEMAKQALLELDRIVEEQPDNQLECLEIYYWYPEYAYPVFACDKLQLYIANAWLPKLNSIIMRPAVDQPLSTRQLIDEDTAMDASALLFVVVTRQPPIETLQLLLPEKTGYQDWLTHIAEGDFPQLTHLSYRVPDQLITEIEIDYYRRLEHALITIRNVVRHHVKLKSCLIEGDIPPQFTDLVQQIDRLLLSRCAKMQAKKGTIN